MADAAINLDDYAPKAASGEAIDLAKFAPAPEPRGAIGEIAAGLKRGAMVDLPQMAGMALQYASSPGNTVFNLGKGIRDAAEARGEGANLTLHPEQHGAIVNALASGAEMVPSIAAPALVGAGALAALPAMPAIAGTALVAGAAAAPFAAQAGESTLEKGEKAGLTEDAAHTAARLNAGLTFATQMGLGMVGGKILGAGGRLFGDVVRKDGGELAAQTLADLTGRGALVKPFLKDTAAGAAEAVVAGGAQAGGTAAIEKAYGADNKDPWEAAIEQAPSMLGLTAILAPMGLAARAIRANALNKRADALASKDTSPEIRDQLATQYFTELNKVDPESAKHFALNAETAIKNGLPLEVDKGLFQQGAVQPPAPPAAPAEPQGMRALPPPEAFPALQRSGLPPELQDMAGPPEGDFRANELQLARAAEENRRKLVDTHAQIVGELQAAGVEPTRALSFSEFRDAMGEEAKKAGLKPSDLTEADYRDMWEKHQRDVMNDNVRKAQDHAFSLADANKPETPTSAGEAPKKTTLGLAIEDAQRRKQVDDAYRGHVQAQAAAKERDLARIQNESRGAAIAAAAEKGEAPAGSKTLPATSERLVLALKAAKPDGQSMPPKLVKDVSSAISGKKSLEDQVTSLKALRDGKSPESASYEILDRMIEKLGGNDAVQEPGAKGVDVRKQPGDGEKVAKGNAQGRKAAGEGGKPGNGEAAKVGRPKGTTDDRHTIGPPNEVGELLPYTRTLSQARDSGIFGEKQWWQDLAWAVRNPDTKIGRDLLDNGKFTDEQMAGAIARDERYQRADALMEQMRVEREARLREQMLADAQPEEAKEILRAKDLKNIFGGDESDYELRKSDDALDNTATLSTKGGVNPSLHEQIRTMLEHSKLTPPQRLLAIALTKLQLKTRFSVAEGRITKDGMPLDGAYSRARDWVVVSSDAFNPATVLHEAVHAATLRALDAAMAKFESLRTGKISMRDLTPMDREHVRAVTDLIGVMDEARQKAKAAGEVHYGLKNEKEFIAEALSSPEFQAFLAAGEKQEKSLLQRFFDSIKKLLGFNVPDTLLHRALNASERFIGLNETKTPEFKKWFGDSKMVDEYGRPKVFYHGSDQDIRVFESGGSQASKLDVGDRVERLGLGKEVTDYVKQAAGNLLTHGIYFTEIPQLADFYAGNRVVSNPRAPGEARAPVMYPVYLKMERPYYVKDGDKHGSAYISKERLAELQRKGYDGIVGQNGETIVFDGSQVKSLFGRKFDPADADISAKPSWARFSRGPGSAAGQTDSMLERVTKLSDAPLSIKQGFTRAHLAFATLNHIRQVFKDVLPGAYKTALDAYGQAKDLAKAMIESRNREALEVSRIMAALGEKESGLDTKLYRLMGESSRFGISPGLPLDKQPWKHTPEKVRKYNELSAIYRSNPDLAKAYDAALAYNKADMGRMYATVARNIARYSAMPRELWSKIDVTKGRSAEVQALEKWLLTHGSTEQRDAMRGVLAQYQAKQQGDYFHLGRNGDYFARFTVKNTPEARAAYEKTFGVGGLGDRVIAPEDSHVFARFESVGEWQHVAQKLNELHAAGHIEPDMQTGMLEKMLGGFDSSSPAFVRGMLRNIEADARLDPDEKRQAQDTLRRLAIEMLPETSASKAFAQRKGVAGYDVDMNRNFVKRAQATAYFVAHNATRPEVEDSLVALKEGVKSLQDATSPHYDNNRGLVAAALQNEIKQRQANDMMPVSTPVMDTVSALSHSFYLAANPAFFMMKTLQPWQLALPQLGARHGFVASFKAMTGATAKALGIIKDTIGDGWVRDKWHGILDPNMVVDRSRANAQEKEFLKSLIAAGGVTFTQAHDMGRISGGNSEGVSTAVKAANASLHYSEALDRMTAGLAAFNLELKRTGDMDKATQYGIQMVKNTLYDYNSHNKGRMFTKQGLFGSATPMLTQFAQYQIQTIELLGRLSSDAFGKLKDDMSPEERTAAIEQKGEARKALAGIMATTMVLAGSMGLPAVSVIAAAYNGIFGTADNPADALGDYRNFLADTFGKDAAEIIAHGGIRALGSDLGASHLGFENIVPFSGFLSDRRKLQDRFDHGALSMMGPAVGAASGIAFGIQDMLQGRYMKGLEAMLPSGLKGLAKAADLGENGLTDITGNRLPVDINSWDVFTQAFNATPAKVAEQREAQRGANTTNMLLKQRAMDLKENFAVAAERGDGASMQSLQQQINAFNQQNPDMAIRDLTGIMRMRAMNREMVQQTGVAAKARELPRMQADQRFANVRGMP